MLRRPRCLAYAKRRRWSRINRANSAPSLESTKRGRVGLEAGYTGRQALEDDPYRSVSEAYFELNALGEIALVASRSL